MQQTSPDGEILFPQRDADSLVKIGIRVATIVQAKDTPLLDDTA